MIQQQQTAATAKFPSTCISCCSDIHLSIISIPDNQLSTGAIQRHILLVVRPFTFLVENIDMYLINIYIFNVAALQAKSNSTSKSLTPLPAVVTGQRSSLRAISGIVHAHHSCGGKRGKLSGPRLSTIFKFASIQVSDTFTSGGYLRIFWTK